MHSVRYTAPLRRHFEYRVCELHRALDNPKAHVRERIPVTKLQREELAEGGLW